MTTTAVAYPIKTKPSQSEDLLLKYSLRSLEANGGKFGDLFLIGKRREWFSPRVRVCDIHYGIESNSKFSRVTSKMVVFSSMEIPFVLMNDDFLLLQPQEITQAKYKAFPSVKSIAKEHSSHTYRDLLERTQTKFNKGKDSFAFITHTPLLIDSPKLVQEITTMYNRRSFSFRQAYALIRGLTKHPLLEIVKQDVKIKEKQTAANWPKAFAGHDMVSFHPAAVNQELFKALEKMFPNKSRFEI